MKNNILKEDLEPVIKLLTQEDPKLTSGPSVLEFERLWSDWLGVKYSVFVNSGSSANLLLLAWLKTQYPQGGRVVVPPFTWSSDVSSVLWMGFRIEFVDIDLATLAIDENRLEECLNKYDDIRAVFLTHAQGLNGLTPKIIRLCKERGITLLEDVCESHGAEVATGIKAGSVGDISCFSFYYAHHMSTIEGGMVCTNDREVYEYMRMVRSHGMLRESTDEGLKDVYTSKYKDLNPLFIFTHPGFNVRNNEIGALIGISQLSRLDRMIRKRAANFEYFLENLPSWAFTEYKLEGQSNYAFNIILKDADQDLMDRLEDKLTVNSVEYRKGSAGGGNQIRQPYVKSIPMFANVEPNVVAPVADHVHFFGMYLGNYPELGKDEIDSLTKIISEV